MRDIERPEHHSRSLIIKDTTWHQATAFTHRRRAVSLTYKSKEAQESEVERQIEAVLEYLSLCACDVEEIRRCKPALLVLKVWEKVVGHE